jgi:hypothetical protein
MRFLPFILLHVCFAYIPFQQGPDFWTYQLNEDGIEVARGPLNSDGLNPFKAEAKLLHKMEDVISAILDLKHRPRWVPKMDTVTHVSPIGELEYHFIERYKTPWPAKDREFLLRGKTIIVSENHTKLLAESDSKNLNLSSTHIEAFIKRMEISVHKIKVNETLVVFKMEADLGGWLPKWLTNLIQKKWPLRFIQGLKKTLREKTYQDSPYYLEWKTKLDEKF